MKFRKGQYVRVLKTDQLPVRYHGRYCQVLKRTRKGYCEVQFPEAHRVTPMAIANSHLKAI